MENVFIFDHQLIQQITLMRDNTPTKEFRES